MIMIHFDEPLHTAGKTADDKWKNVVWTFEFMEQKLQVRPEYGLK